MKWLCYMGILKEGFSAYSSPIMLISRKLTEDKRVVDDFRHWNVRIAKNNLAHPLIKDTFSVLGSSKCEVLPVLDLKDAFHSLRLSKKSKKNCGILPYFGSTSYLYQRMPMGLNISCLIWQSYINMILDCLQRKKILWSNNGWSSIVHTVKKVLYRQIGTSIESIIEKWTEDIS